jgi:NTP pyrophosphatase (non-canonical NTP hydrolase)
MNSPTDTHALHQQERTPSKATRNVPSYKTIAEELSAEIIDLRDQVEALKAQGLMNAYQQWAWSTQLPSSTNTEYLGLGLAGEVGEVTGILAKLKRDGGPLDRPALVKELGDVLWFVAGVSTFFGIPLSEVAQSNFDKISSRQARGVLGGSGDNR